MTGQKKLPVVCAVIERDGELLAWQRAHRQGNGGMWEFPGGKIRPSETPAAALKRELQEELGVEASIGKQLPASIYENETVIIELIPFRCTLLPGTEPSALEHERIAWIDYNRARTLRWTPADIPVLENLCRNGYYR
jgi:8-oxo-dGTP diphosphatase